MRHHRGLLFNQVMAPEFTTSMQMLVKDPESVLPNSTHAESGASSNGDPESPPRSVQEENVKAPHAVRTTERQRSLGGGLKMVKNEKVWGGGLQVTWGLSFKVQEI